MSSRPVIRILGALAGLAAFALAWLLLAPPAFGGKTSIVITSGNSMDPKLHEGDLVIARQRPSYGVGDVVLFRSPTLGREVLHRIVAVADGRFVTKGDNNDYRDPGRVSPADVHGEAVLLVPGAGKPVAWLRHPLNAAIALFVLVFLSLAGGREVARRRPRPTGRPLQPADVRRRADGQAVAEGVAAGAHTVLVAGAVALGLFTLLAVIAWRAPRTTAYPVGQAYEHTGSFSYSAEVRPSAVYPDGQRRDRRHGLHEARSPPRRRVRLSLRHCSPSRRPRRHRPRRRDQRRRRLVPDDPDRVHRAVRRRHGARRGCARPSPPRGARRTYARAHRRRRIDLHRHARAAGSGGRLRR